MYLRNGQIFLMVLILCSGCSINNTNKKNDISIMRSGESTSNDTVTNSRESKVPCVPMRGTYNEILDSLENQVFRKNKVCACSELEKIAKHNSYIDPDAEFNIKLRHLNARLRCHILNIPEKRNSLIFQNENEYH